MRHVAVMSLTSSLGLMAVFAVDFVDMVFIAMLGKMALAALFLLRAPIADPFIAQGASRRHQPPAVAAPPGPRWNGAPCGQPARHRRVQLHGPASGRACGRGRG